MDTKKRELGVDQYYYGHGKVLLSGEYFVLDGAKALALPTSKGQSLSVKYSSSFDPVLTWKSYDHEGNIWYESKFEFWRFECLKPDPTPQDKFLQKILKEARNLNSHFLRDEVNVHVETHLEFPLEWGLGSSSTLIYNIAQWAYVSPFELLFKTSTGSGYDIACSQSDGPIIFERESTGPRWCMVNFDPEFKDSIYFLALGQKQSSNNAIEYYKSRSTQFGPVVASLTKITDDFLNCNELQGFEKLIADHEGLISSKLDLPKVKELHFSDFWGQIKSLGAWGGDLALVTSNRGLEETAEYFKNKGFDSLLSYDDLILNTQQASLFEGDPAANVHEFNL
jgi:mevalonate kinase